MGLSLEDKEVTQLYTLLSVHKLSYVQWPISGRLWEKVTWFIIDHDVLCVICSDLWTEELAGKFVFYAITHN